MLETGLKSPVIRNRNMALKALSEWEREKWPANMERLLAEARDREPDEQVRKRIENVLAGRPLENAIASALG